MKTHTCLYCLKLEAVFSEHFNMEWMTGNGRSQRMLSRSNHAQCRGEHVVTHVSANSPAEGAGTQLNTNLLCSFKITAFALTFPIFAQA